MADARFDRLCRVYVADGEACFGYTAFRQANLPCFLVVKVYAHHAKGRLRWLRSATHLYSLPRREALLRACALAGCPKAQARLALEAM